MDQHLLTTLPVVERRGCWEEQCGNTWQSILLAGGMDAVARGMQQLKEIGLFECDVTRKVLSGRLTAPNNKWALLVEIAGSDWIHLVGPFVRSEIKLAERLASKTGLKVLETGYQKTACATYVKVFEGNQILLRFESAGEEFSEHPLRGVLDEADLISEPTILESSTYPKNWWRQFKREQDVQHALLVELDAYVPFLQAELGERNKICLTADHQDVIAGEHIERVDLVVWGSIAPTKFKQASHSLAEAIQAVDLKAATKAIREGADLHFLPGIITPPLGFAIAQLGQRHHDCLNLIKALLAAGADPNGGGSSSLELPLIQAVLEMKNKNNRSTAIEAISILLDAGANLDLEGSLPIVGRGMALHAAVGEYLPIAVELLCQRGADVSVRDSIGRTPLEQAKAMLKNILQFRKSKFVDRQCRALEEIIACLMRVSH